MNMVGKNTIAGGRLMSFIERCEQQIAVKDQAGKDVAAILAEPMGNGSAARRCHRNSAARELHEH
jgi:uncharacterized protein (UPF0335 family)